MFLSKLAERTGLFEFLAPIIGGSDNNGDNQQQSAYVSNNDDESSQENKELVKRRRLDAQKKAEEDAEARGVFAKKQRVRYHNKSTDVICDAIVVGVHFDDGLEHPYYTIKHKKQIEEELEDGCKKVDIVEVEKQTNPDRLQRVPWDDELSWKVLK
mmetsp:Transcript_3742/g.8316  ORF Transcript_3742/g.8316 Transcript_3742/m.8316 type:complete len:156 (-) Transcript_3742:362-829(-)